MLSDSIYEPVTDNTLGTHTYTYNGYTCVTLDAETQYWGYGTASLSIGDSYADWANKTWTYDLGTAGYLGDDAEGGWFAYAAIPVTFTGTYDIVASTPEPATLLLLGAGLIGLAGFSRKKLFKKS